MQAEKLISVFAANGAAEMYFDELMHNIDNPRGIHASLTEDQAGAIVATLRAVGANEIDADDNPCEIAGNTDGGAETDGFVCADGSIALADAFGWSAFNNKAEMWETFGISKEERE